MREGVKNHSHVSLILLALLSLYLAYFFASIYVPSAQFFLDTDSIAEQKVMVFVYDREPVALLPDGADCFVGVIQSSGGEKRVSVRVDGDTITSCAVDGEEKTLQPIRRYTPTMRGRIVSAWIAV